MAPSQSFSGTLRRVMRAHGVTSEEVAVLAGVSRSTVSTWFARRNIPTPEIAARLAKALDAPHLAMAAHEERARTCDYCGLVFEAFNRRSVARFCSGPCRTRWWHVERRKESHQKRLDHLTMLRNQVEELLAEKAVAEKAIKAHCYRCEPDGVCHDGGCDIRSISPFILVERRYA